MTGAGRLASTDAIVEKVRDVLGLRRDLEGQHRARHRRPHARRYRSCSLPHQSLVRQNGLRAGGSGVASRRARRFSSAAPRTCPVPEGVDWVPVRINRRNAPRRARARRRKRTSSSWPRPWPIIARPRARRKSSSAAKVGSRWSSNPRRIFSPSLAREKGQSHSGRLCRRNRRSSPKTHARKLARKGADMIVANDVTQEGAGFDTRHQYRHAISPRRPRDPAPQDHQIRSSQPHPRSRPRNPEALIPFRI